MALNTTLDKTRKDLEKALSDSRPLLAVVGAGDLAVEKIREVRAGIEARAARIDVDAVRTQAQTRVDAVQSEVLHAPEQAKALPAKAQAVLNEYVANAVSAYDDLAGRGKVLVTRIRKQQATEDLEKHARTTVSRAKATTTTAKKSASRSKTAAKSATTTAKKQAKATKTAAKSTATSARKTAEAATQATTDAASKVGDGTAG